MTLLNFEIFNMVVSYQSFQKAAEQLNLTPSAVSHAITKFETEIGLKLFVRHRSGVELTDAGHILLPYVRTFINDVEQLEQVVSRIKGLETGCVKVGMFNSVCVNWIPNIIKGYTKAHPNIDIQIFQGGYEDVAAWIENATIDMGFVSLSSEYPFEIQPLYRDPLVCIVPKGFKCKSPGVVTIEDLKEQYLVHQSEGNDAETSNYLKRHDVSVSTPFQIEDDQSLLAIVESGLGICLVPELLIKNGNHNVDSYPISPEAYRVIGLATRDEKGLSPVAKSFYNFVLHYMKAEGIYNV
jgi:DNA-binding transcriptional LysR family regulator